MKKFLPLLFIPALVLAQFGGGFKTNRIDKIESEVGPDLILDPNNRVKVNYFSGQKALQSSATGELEESALIDTTELSNLDGSIENIQTSLDSKALKTTTITPQAPLNGGGDLSANRTIGIDQAGVLTDGFLSSTDWNTFNNKQDALTFGNLTEATSSVLTINGGAGAVIGAGTSIEVQQSSSTLDGFLSSTDWNTFNNKQNAITGTNGDLYYWNSSFSNLPIGTTGQLLTVNGLGLPSWQDAPVSTTLDSQGQLQGFSTTNAAVGPCVNNEILIYDASEATGWKCGSQTPASPTTTEGDLIIRGISEDERLPIGTSGTVLTSNGTTASWQPSSGLPSQSGQGGKYLRTNGSVAAWQNINNDTADIKTNLLLCPSFEGCGLNSESWVVTTDAVLDGSGTGTRLIEPSAYNDSYAYIEGIISPTWIIKAVTTKTVNLSGQRMRAYCEIRTLRPDVKFIAGANGVSAGEKNVISDGKWRFYELQLDGGDTSQYIEINGETTASSEPISIDNCFIGKISPADSTNIDALAEKVTPVADDLLVIEDSAENFNKKKIKISSLPTGGGGGGGIDFTNTKVLYDEFTGASNVTAGAFYRNLWYATIIGTGSGIIGQFINDSNTTMGVVHFTTGTTATGTSSLGINSAMRLTDFSKVIYYARVNIPTLSDGTNNFYVLPGFVDNGSAGDEGNGIFFQYQHSLNSGRWTGVTEAGNVRTQVDSGVAVLANTWYNLKFVFTKFPTPTVEFYVNNTLVGSSTTTIFSNIAVGTAFKNRKLAGTAARLAYLDTIYVEATP